jgi:hypothetical protein
VKTSIRPPINLENDPKIIFVTIRQGLVADVTGIPDGYEVVVEDYDGYDSAHPAWDDYKQCFVTIHRP